MKLTERKTFLGIQFGKNTLDIPDEQLRSAGITPKELFKELFSNYSTVSGESITEDSALKFSAVYACVRIISETIASLPLNLHQKTNKGSVIPEDDPLQNILHNQPNELMTSFNFWEVLISQLTRFGNAYAIITRKRGEITGLYPVQNQHVEISFITKTGEPVYTIAGEKFFASDIIHLSILSDDGIIGKSPIRYHAESIGLGMAATKFGASFFGNGANVTGILTTPTILKNDVIEKIRESWKKTYSGAKKGNQTAILDAGFDYKRIGIPPEEAQFLQTREFQITDIARIYRVPPHLLADLTRSTNNNIEEQGIDFVRHCIRPYCVRIEKELFRKLLNSEKSKQYYFKFNLDALLRGNSSQRAEFYSKMFQNGLMSQNEIRGLEDMNLIDNGDVYYIPVNVVKLD